MDAIIIAPRPYSIRFFGVFYSLSTLRDPRRNRAGKMKVKTMKNQILKLAPATRRPGKRPVSSISRRASPADWPGLWDELHPVARPIGHPIPPLTLPPIPQPTLSVGRAILLPNPRRSRLGLGLARTLQAALVILAAAVLTTGCQVLAYRGPIVGNELLILSPLPPPMFAQLSSLRSLPAETWATIAGILGLLTFFAKKLLARVDERTKL